MEKFTMKRPQKADYVNKYGFQGERIWRIELLKYEEAKQAFDRRQANIKAYQEKIKKEQKAIRDYKRTKELYPDVYEAGGESAIKHLAKIHNSHKSIAERKPEKKSFEDFKEARKKLGLKSTQKDYQNYLVRIGATNAPKKTTAKKTTAKPKGRATAKDQKATPKKTIARGKKKSPARR